MQFLQKISLTNRLLTTATLALIVALGMIGVVMDRAFKEKTLDLVEERLEGYVIALITAIDVDAGQNIMVYDLPIPKLDQPQSGMYAQILSEASHWKSNSLLGYQLPIPKAVDIGSTEFDAPLKVNGGDYFRMTRGLIFETETGEVPFVLSVTEDAKNYFRELREFQENLMIWLIITSVILLGVQGLIMKWSLKPLKRLTATLADLEAGKIEEITHNYPTELAGLTTNLNKLLSNEKLNIERHRKTLADLAHSLKTPLAVVHSELENREINQDLISEQITNMNDIVAYQLKRAAVVGHRTFTVGVPVIDNLEKILRTLDKVYRNKRVKIKVQVGPGAEFFGERGDLLELLGNLLENAYKWCDQNVSITIKTLTYQNRKRTGLSIEIADDGPGIPEAKRKELLLRGVRGDEKVKGHGIGLSIVSDIVDSYQGSMEISLHPVLHGAHFDITLPP